MTSWKTLAMNFTTAYDANTLEGLPGVNVVVTLDKDDAFQEVDARDGLTVETLQSDLGFQLKLVGIRVLTEEERLLTPSCPVLSVAVGIVEARGLTDVYAYLVTVGLYQVVTLTSGLRTTAGTWNMGHVGFAVSSKVRTLVREQVKDKIITFVNAWQTVNRK
jgi:hypothetical protein